MSRCLPLLLVAMLAACQPAPVDPAFDETAGAALLAKYEAARAGGDFEIAELHGDELSQRHGETKAARSMRRTIVEVRAEAGRMRERRRLAGLWDYQQVPAGEGVQHTAAIYSKVPPASDEEGAPLPIPDARLILRKHPDWGDSAYLVLQLGKLECGPPCRLSIRFDAAPAREFAGEPADTGTGPALFIEDREAFLAGMRAASRVRITLPRSGALVPMFEFEVAGFDADRTLADD